METLREKRPELLVGAGTILDETSLKAAQDSGAVFGVAPGFDLGIFRSAEAARLPFVPGIMTPSELGAAMRVGARVLKFFPATIAGGPAALEGIAAPFAHLDPRFIRTRPVKLSITHNSSLLGTAAHWRNLESKELLVIHC